MLCPNCKEEIENDSYFCDQCGQKLSFCIECGAVGIGRHCTLCGGEMRPRCDEAPSAPQQASDTTLRPDSASSIKLTNKQLGISFTVESESVIGRREGPYAESLSQYAYMSGKHAIIQNLPDKGWCITDLNSTNGTKINQKRLAANMPYKIKNGDIVSFANINLIVIE